MRRWIYHQQSKEILASESFTRWLVEEREREGIRKMLQGPYHLWGQKVQMNLIVAVKAQVSPLPISVLTIQTAFTDWQNIIFVGAHHLPKILGQKQPLMWLSTSHQ